MLKVTIFIIRIALPAALLVFSTAWADLNTAQVTLQDFGYEKVKAPQSVPLLVITAQYESCPLLAHTNPEYDSLIFNPFIPPSVNGYFLENSKGRFFWSRAGQGTIGPFPLPASVGQETNDNKRPAKVIEAAMTSGFNFAQFDANSNGKVEGNELSVLIIESYPSKAARGTDPRCIKTSGSSVEVCVTVLLLGDRPSLFDLAHELSHFLGTKDLYGRWGVDNLHFGCTLMGGPVGGADARQSVHLDPWHKLQLGWLEPQIRAINSFGVPTLPAANAVASDSAIILFDPQRGPNEYFLLEYRTSRQQGFHYDRDVCGNGLAIWHVVQDGKKDPVSVPNLTGNGATYLGVFLESAPMFQRGGNQLWGSGAIIQRLRWLDNTQTNTCLFVRPFSDGDSNIVIDMYPPLDKASPCRHPHRVVGPTPPTPDPCGALRTNILAQQNTITALRQRFLRATSQSEREELQSQIDVEVIRLDGLIEDYYARGCRPLGREPAPRPFGP